MPKYYNSPGMQKSQVLYNYDRALDMPAVVVVEGVPSVWRIGRAAVCLFGKTLSAWQCNTLSTAWSGKPVFFMLDNDAQIEIDSAVTELCRHGVNVVPVILPDSRDPADYSRAELRDILRAAAEAVEVKVDMSFMD
jgi:DNA primase